jgi:hypothetical protein
MFRLAKPDEVKQVEDLDLVRMTRYEVLDRYGVSAMHYRAQVIREQVLTAEVLKGMIAKALEMPEGVKKGRLVWEALLPLVPLQPHGLDRWDVQWAAEEVLRTEEQRYEPPSGVWWWRLRVVHGIADPVAWVVEQAEKREKGWARRVGEMALGREAPVALVYLLVKRCQEFLKRREERGQK